MVLRLLRELALLLGEEPMGWLRRAAPARDAAANDGDAAALLPCWGAPPAVLDAVLLGTVTLWGVLTGVLRPEPGSEHCCVCVCCCALPDAGSVSMRKLLHVATQEKLSSCS
jgi:hypothetical protein